MGEAEPFTVPAPCRGGQVLWRRTRRSSVGTRDRNPDPDSALDRVLGATTVCSRDEQWNEEGFC